MSTWDDLVQEILERPGRDYPVQPITNPDAHPDFKCCGPTEFVYVGTTPARASLGPLIRCTTCQRTWRQS